MSIFGPSPHLALEQLAGNRVIEFPDELDEPLLPNGTSFVVLKVDGRIYLEMGLKGRQLLIFDVTLPGCPFEKALWALERKWPERCRG